MKNCPHCGAEPFPKDLQPEPSLHAYTTIYPCRYETVTVLGEDEEEMVAHKCNIETDQENLEDMIDLTNKIWQWEPLEYICEGFDNNFETVHGVFPIDIREKCSFTVKRIHGPVVKGLGSWLMHQLVNTTP